MQKEIFYCAIGGSMPDCYAPDELGKIAEIMIVLTEMGKVRLLTNDLAVTKIESAGVWHAGGSGEEKPQFLVTRWYHHLLSVIMNIYPLVHRLRIIHQHLVAKINEL